MLEIRSPRTLGAAFRLPGKPLALVMMGVVD